MARRDVQGFGFDPDESLYHFAVVIGRGDADPVVIDERLSWAPPDEEQAPRPPTPKAYVDRYRWSLIADVVRAEFNRRLREEGHRTAAWKTGETLLAPHFGKELTLLAWAVEDADPTVIPNMRANWLGLVREERWWLYTTVNAAGGHPERGRDRGWRQAIKIAFRDNPIAAPTLGLTLPNEPADEARPALNGRQHSRRKTRGATPTSDQPSLFQEPQDPS